MAEYAPLDLPDHPKLVDNITHFARALRKAGLPVGPSRVIDAIRAVRAVGVLDRRGFYWTLQACFISRREHRVLFAQVFRLFWRDPRYMEHMMALMLPSVRGVQEDHIAKAAEKRASEALLDGMIPDDVSPETEEGQCLNIDASRTMSDEERLRTLDFEQMSVEEIATAKRMLARMTLPVPPIRSRRWQGASAGRVDARTTLRHAMRYCGDVMRLHHRQPRVRWPALVTLCDISGSMSQYSRMALHFLHTVMNQKGASWAQVHAFTFGTQLTNITRHLNQRDVDAALSAAGAEAQDWQGGTRIGDCIEHFNRNWSRRVMGQGAVVLLITDGLERGDPDHLARHMERLHLSARHVIWLNPLLRFDGFMPRAQGVKAMIPYVDDFRAGHNVASIQSLVQALSDSRTL